MRVRAAIRHRPSHVSRDFNCWTLPFPQMATKEQWQLHCAVIMQIHWTSLDSQWENGMGINNKTTQTLQSATLSVVAKPGGTSMLSMVSMVKHWCSVPWDPSHRQQLGPQHGSREANFSSSFTRYYMHIT